MKYLVVGNPISHSLSPELHNYWFKINKIKATYEKKEILNSDLKNLILDMREKKIDGINITVPFKNKIIPYLDELTTESKNTQSVNTVYLQKDKIIGHNTDIDGFRRSLEKIKFNFEGKNILILGAGGVVPSMISALNTMSVSKIFVSNRTKEKAEKLKNIFKNIDVVKWGYIPNFDVIINATSVGLKKDDKLNLDFTKVGKNKLFYDVIYNPSETNFLKSGKKLGNIAENGKMMFVYQALYAFKIWHSLEPKINDEVLKIVSND